MTALFFAVGCATHRPPSSAADDYLHAVMEKNQVPGVALAIVRDGKVEQLSAYGLADLESGVEVGVETSFQMASATKVFTGTLVMLLVQEGKLDLDAPLSKYLSDAPEAWKAMTIRHLTAHASGLKDLSDEESSTATVGERYEAAKKTALAYSPGERSEYSLTDFVVLAHVLEKLTGERFEELLRSRIFQPLGFSCTRYEHARQEGGERFADVIPRRASLYRFVDGVPQRAWFLYPAHTYAAGGIFSCVKDLARWAVAMDQGTLLTPAMQQAGATPLKLNDGRVGGFGVAFAVSKLRGLQTFGHSGGGSLGDVLRIPEKKLTVLLLTNKQGLLPVLAPNIASLLLPPSPELDEPGIADTEPALTATLRGVAEGVMNGTLDAAAFAPSAQEGLVPVLRGFGTPGSALYPPVHRVVLLEDRKDGEPRKRVLRVVYGKDISVKWTFSLDSAGKVLDLDYEWE
ncbi:serine hydrolase domain-containing protein [Hyalangium versicolor]|uniref:serine hydrolase domain-containing protein n=1 Tax=Hyalangium versicolor TaxID=2861190 RepID=UPI001CCB2991|nr:serine hydrolase domain-containing protein [Hyalangium versicolor]